MRKENGAAGYPAASAAKPSALPKLSAAGRSPDLRAGRVEKLLRGGAFPRMKSRSGVVPPFTSLTVAGAVPELPLSF